MTKYIPKSALVAEIERRRLYHIDLTEYNSGYKNAIWDVLSFLDTLEVKEVDERKERMSECSYRQVGCAMYEGKILECKGACSWVIDHLKLKELKAQKGEET